MKVRVRFFAGLREALGCEAEDLELPLGTTTVGALLESLRQRGAPWSEVLAEGRPIRAAVNQDMAVPRTALHTGDEVAFFPPVTGG